MHWEVPAKSSVHAAGPYPLAREGANWHQRGKPKTQGRNYRQEGRKEGCRKARRGPGNPGYGPVSTLPAPSFGVGGKDIEGISPTNRIFPAVGGCPPQRLKSFGKAGVCGPGSPNFSTALLADAAKRGSEGPKTGFARPNLSGSSQLQGRRRPFQTSSWSNWRIQKKPMASRTRAKRRMAKPIWVVNKGVISSGSITKKTKAKRNGSRPMSVPESLAWAVIASIFRKRRFFSSIPSKSTSNKWVKLAPVCLEIL